MFINLKITSFYPILKIHLITINPNIMKFQLFTKIIHFQQSFYLA